MGLGRKISSAFRTLIGGSPPSVHTALSGSSLPGQWLIENRSAYIEQRVYETGPSSRILVDTIPAVSNSHNSPLNVMCAPFPDYWHVHQITVVVFSTRVGGGVVLGAH